MLLLIVLRGIVALCYDCNRGTKFVRKWINTWQLRCIAATSKHNDDVPDAVPLEPPNHEEEASDDDMPYESVDHIEYDLRRGELLALKKAVLVSIASHHGTRYTEKMNKEVMVDILARMVSTSAKQMKYMRDLCKRHHTAAGSREYAFKGSATAWITAITEPGPGMPKRRCRP